MGDGEGVEPVVVRWISVTFTHHESESEDVELDRITQRHTSNISLSTLEGLDLNLEGNENNYLGSSIRYLF